MELSCRSFTRVSRSFVRLPFPSLPLVFPPAKSPFLCCRFLFWSLALTKLWLYALRERRRGGTTSGYRNVVLRSQLESPLYLLSPCCLCHIGPTSSPQCEPKGPRTLCEVGFLTDSSPKLTATRNWSPRTPWPNWEAHDEQKCQTADLVHLYGQKGK